MGTDFGHDGREAANDADALSGDVRPDDVGEVAGRLGLGTLAFR